MKTIALALIFLSAIFLKSCHLEKQARDTSAALQGVLVASQAKYHDSCVANPKQLTCLEINRGVAANDLLITAVETYCGWSVTMPPADTKAKCVPVQSAQAGLNAAIANASSLTQEIKGLL